LGSTFGAVHIRNASAARLGKLVRRSVESEGCTLLEPSADESETDRRVLVFEEGGWGVVADEDLECTQEAGELLARELSRSLKTDAVSISVLHSDYALLSRFRGGRRLGGFRVPDDARRDRRSGHAFVQTKFLASLAVSKEAKASLERGLLADHTFPEETVREAAELIGLPCPGAGAGRLWREPPDGALKLRFAPPGPEEIEDDGMDFRPPGAKHDIFLSSQEQLSLRVGEPLHDRLTVSAQAFAGPRVEGLGVELSGTGLALLDVLEVTGWNPMVNLDGAASKTEILVARLETPSDASRRAFFPEAFVAPAPQPTLLGTSAAAFRAWSAALSESGRNQFYFDLSGAASRPGTGDLRVRLLDRQGDPLDTNEVHVSLEVGAAPRIPVTPRPVAIPDDPHLARRLIQSASDYGGSSFLCGWIGFDEAWAELFNWILDQASQLAAVLARRNPLEVGLTSAGTHPTVSARFGPEDHLAKGKRFGIVTRTLAVEGSAELLGSYDPSKVEVRHQPHGATLFDAETRAHLAALRPEARVVPVDLGFALSRPDSPRERQEIAALVDRVFVEAAARPDCVGGFAAPLGSVPHGDCTPYEEIVSAHNLGDQLEVVRRYVRCPGWRVIVPRPATARLARLEGITCTETAAGALLRSVSIDPFEMSDADREAAERAVVGCIAVPDPA
jgi:hypothetical protein